MWLTIEVILLVISILLSFYPPTRIFGLLLVVLFLILGLVLIIRNKKEKDSLDERINKLEKKFYDKNNNEVSGFTGVKVLQYKILSSQKGYMKIRVFKDYLNTSFNDSITLKYEYGKYQPVMLTFKNDDRWGAGVIFNSPEYKKRAEVYLNQCIRFSGGGNMTYTEDLIFELYFNDYCMYFVTISGMVKFEHTISPIRFGRNLCIGYFDENNSERNKNASKDFPYLEGSFRETFQNKQQ